jgi:hypothetical protein
MRTFVLACCVLPALAACSTYALHRAALVPRATPIPGDGQPMTTPGELSLGASNVAELVKPGVGDPNAGVAVPGTQLRGALALRATDNLSLAAIYEHGLASTAHAVTSSQPSIDNGPVVGYGLGWTYSIRTGTPGFRVAIANEIVFWSTPWVQYSTCVDMCVGTPGSTVVDRGSSIVPAFVLGVTPSYRTGRVTIFGGLTLRNHPTIVEKVDTNYVDDPDVSTGPWNLIAHAGVSVELGAGVRASVLVHQDLVADPVAYGPGIGVMLAIPIGGERAPQPAL